MALKTEQNLAIRSKVKQLLYFTFAFSIISISMAGEPNRAPASYLPSDTMEGAPTFANYWIENLLQEDDSGVLTGMRDQFRQWEATDEYAENWNLKSTGYYETPSDESRKRYFNKRILRYIDKRISGEVKHAKEGTALHSVGTVQKALRPASSVQVSEKIKIKFRAKVLQGRATLKVVNPWVDYETNMNVKGEVNMNVRRDIASLGVGTHVHYDVRNGVWKASVNRRLTDTVTAEVYSQQDHDKMAFSDDSNRVIQFIYSQPF